MTVSHVVPAFLADSAVQEARDAVKSGNTRDGDAAIARTLGLTRVAETLNARGNASTRIKQLRDLGLPEICDADYRTWCEFLPTSYNLSEGTGSWYTFDTPPSVVLHRMGQVTGIASAIEIRTPEARRPDPVAFAHVYDVNGKRTTFLVARWAESADHLVDSVDEVKKILIARHGTKLRFLSSLVSTEPIPLVLSVCIAIPPLVARQDFPQVVWFSVLVATCWIGVHALRLAALLARKWALRRANPKLARLV